MFQSYTRIMSLTDRVVTRQRQIAIDIEAAAILNHFKVVNVNPIRALVLGDRLGHFIQELFISFIQKIRNSPTQNGDPGDDDD